METERLILRNFNKKDLNDFFEYAKNENVGPNAGWAPHKNIKYTKRILNIFMHDKLTFAIVLKEKNKVIGSISLIGENNINDFPNVNQLELGYSLSFDYWNNGYATEAARKIIEYAFVDLGIDILWCGCFINNIRSKHVIEKLNFELYKEILYKPEISNSKIRTEMFILTKDKYKRVTK